MRIRHPAERGLDGIAKRCRRGDGTVRVWRLADGAPVAELLLPLLTGSVNAVAVGALPDARYPVHLITEAGMARKITIVFDEDLDPEEYAARGNGIWGVLKIAHPGGGFHLERDGGTPDGFLNDWWARQGSESPWQ